MNPITLGELEKQVMEIVWEYKKCSVKDILERLTSKKKLAYTTVATVLDRLYIKGLLILKSDGSKRIYTPALSKTEYSNKIVRAFLKGVTASFGEIAITSFADGIEHLPKKKRDKLLELLNKKVNLQ
jgi:BlaI family transcriptional regulator, penicillinase repressor